MSQPRRSLTSLLLLVLFSATLLAQTPQPPVAPLIAHQETRHGATVVENYFWLRDKSNPEVIKYLDSENATPTRSPSRSNPSRTLSTTKSSPTSNKPI